MARGSRLFDATEVKRLAKTARDAGFSVDRMGIVVEEGKITLLPPSNSNAFDDALDAELEAIDKRGARGR